MNKTNRILLAILGIQVVAILVLDNPWTSGPYRTETERVPFFSGFEVSRAMAFQLEKGDQQIRLERISKEENTWDVKAGALRYRADQFSVDTLMNSLLRLKKNDPVSRNPEKALIYDLEGAEAIFLTVDDEAGSHLVSLMVGKNLGALRGTYVKQPGENEVYLVMENIRRACDRGGDWVAQWRDKTVLSCDRASIECIDWQGPEGVIHIRQNQGEEALKMLAPQQGSVKAWEGNRLLQTLSELQAQGFSEKGLSPADLGLVPPELTIEVRLREETGEIQHTFRLSKEKAGTRYLQSEANPGIIFKVSSHPFAPFIQKPGELLESTP